MKSEILCDLTYVSRLPTRIKNIESDLNSINQTVARAADEIKRLIIENQNLKQQFKKNNKKLTILDKLHEIEKRKNIYNIHYCKAGVGIIFYYPESEINESNWKEYLKVDKYYPTFEEAVEAEYKGLNKKGV